MSVDLLTIVLAITGGLLGLAADRFATRWPEHDEEHPPGRSIDWRTVVCGATGAVAMGLLPQRFGLEPLALLLFGAWFVTLIVGLGTDLDQRLLPNELTLPVIPIALLYALSGLNPLVGEGWMTVVVTAAVAVGVPVLLYVASIPFGAGAFGLGDVKFLIGAGLMLGAERSLGGIVVGMILAGAVLLVLLLARRIARDSYVPFGPFLILGVLWAVLIRG